MAGIWAAAMARATKCRNNPQQSVAVRVERIRPMTEDGDRDRSDTAADPLNETIAGTGGGIPDDSLAPGQTELPEAPTEEEIEKAAKSLGAPGAERDTLPLEGE
jgi:hypothetical protein